MRTRPHLPPWLRRKLGGGERFVQVSGMLAERGLNTVCRSARCPNLGECWSRGTATFMILGDVCTRNCPFCAIEHGRPDPPDTDEPRRLARTAREMRLRWVVVTSVSRDDLPDGGAGHFAAVVREIHRKLPQAGVELLVPDFRGKAGAVDVIAAAAPDVLNHNIETVSRLYPRVRPDADYRHSLGLLREFSDRGLVTKSGLFVGVGETPEEVRRALRDLREHGVRSLTIGQYLQATRNNLPVTAFYTPDEFRNLMDFAYDIGFDHVSSGPFVRSSYRAEEAAEVYGLRQEKQRNDSEA